MSVEIDEGKRWRMMELQAAVKFRSKNKKAKAIEGWEIIGIHH